MASKVVVAEIPSYIKVFSDGSVERPGQTPLVPPSNPDPLTKVFSKDVIISENPAISARLYLPTHEKENDKKVPILVYFHGGGFFFESAFSQLYHHHFNTFVSHTNCIVVSVEYGLALEHPSPLLPRLLARSHMGRFRRRRSPAPPPRRFQPSFHRGDGAVAT
ncbi:hypothetical protein Fmac_023434 [Flemingia macrophylla]|uniref:Alpha/beta hydrolase fold-3 domain-containing protein n=1 Tax=Flemingia macrophylla TaxID=520843 RepID=A0ABD1LLK3_9FABA